MAVPQYRKYKSDADKVRVYEHRLRQAEEANKKWHPAAEKAWARYEAVPRDDQKTGSGHQVSGSTPTAVGILDSLFSSMTAAEIDLSVTAKGQTSEDTAYVAQAALRQEFEETKSNTRGNDAVKDGLITGWGWVKVGYEFYEEEQEVARIREDVFADVGELLEQAEASGQDVPTPDQIAEFVPLTETQTTVLADRIVVDYVPWDMVLLDPTAKRIDDLRWMAQKQYMTREEVVNNPLFQEYTASRRTGKKLEAMKADTVIDKEILGQVPDPKDEDQRFTIYTVYDMETGTVCTYAKGTDFLLNEGPNPFAFNDDVQDKLPFVPYIGRHTGRRIRGVSEIDVLDAILKEKDLYHSLLATYLERMATSKIIAKARAFTTAGKEALKSREVGAVVELDEGFNPSEDIKDFPIPPLMSEVYGMPEKLEQSARDATGVSELMRGLFPDRKRTATETTEVVSASAARQSEKRSTLEDFWLGIAQRILQLMQMFYQQERVVKLTDDVGPEFSWGWTSTDIEGQFGLDIALTPKEPKSWQTRRDNALAVLNIVGPLGQPGPDGSSPASIVELLRYVLGELNIPRRIIRVILNLPEEQQQQVLGQLQNQAAQAQAGAGVVNPAMVPGPMNEQALAAATNQGTIPPQILAAASGMGPGGPQAVEQVSESAGITGLV